MPEAKDALRGLIDRIVLTPTAPEGTLTLHLEGVSGRASEELHQIIDTDLVIHARDIL